VHLRYYVSVRREQSVDQNRIIQLLIEKYNQCQNCEYEIVRWPDQENRNSRDIDAYATAPGGGVLQKTGDSYQ
jgi:hypothetical protein